MSWRDRHIVLVAYYFPPLGLSGVQRVAKFTKYIARHVRKVSVITPKGGAYFAFDPSLLADVAAHNIEIIRTRAFDVNHLLGRKQIALPAESTRGVWARLVDFLFIPDAKVGWTWPLWKALHHVRRKEPIDGIIVSGPPFSSFLPCAHFSRQTSIPLLVDYRDDWVDAPRISFPTAIHKRIHAMLERYALARATSITAINPFIAADISARMPHSCVQHVAVVAQGYDPDDFRTEDDLIPLATLLQRRGDANGATPSEQMHRASSSSRSLVISYTGVFYHAQRPDTFLKAVHILQKANRLPAETRVIFAGLVPHDFQQRVSELGLDNLVKYVGYLPHADSLALCQQSDVLWMTVGRQPRGDQISTGKLYEYLGLNKPILGLVPLAGDAADTLRAYGCAWVAESEDAATAANHLSEMITCWQTNNWPPVHQDFVLQFDRNTLAQQLLAQLWPLRMAKNTWCINSRAAHEALVEDLLSMTSVPDSIRDVVALCTSEAVDNALRHGSTTLDVQVRLEHQDAWLHVSVTQQECNPARHTTPSLPHEEATGGRGEHIMRAAADRVEWTEDGKTRILSWHCHQT